jgi:hypothetical protein
MKAAQSSLDRVAKRAIWHAHRLIEWHWQMLKEIPDDERIYFMNPDDDQNLMEPVHDLSFLPTGELCGIFHENLGDFTVVKLPCLHLFHGDCIRPWLVSPDISSCPYCRREYKN